MSTLGANNVQSPDSDISPKTPNPSKSATGEYFPSQAPTGSEEVGSRPAEEGKGKGKEKAVVPSPESTPASTPVDELNAVQGETAAAKRNGSGPPGRKASVSSLTFQPPRHPSLPQGHAKPTDGKRIRAASPPHKRYHAHVSFDNVRVGESTKNNTASYTLKSSHSGHQQNKRSRTFMVGVDEHSYSDYALEWLLKELVEDGDHVVCVTVIEKEVRSVSEAYKAEAQAKMESIKEKSGPSRAIAITLEYAVGKLHISFQSFIQLHQPAMLIVGTKGRSLGSFQGFVGARNSFSKYCLQYCPIPVVVVRPSEKREKKKAKRLHDEERQTYAKMLPGGIHEADSETSSMYDLEVKLPQDQEAHEVARVLGLPAAFDPTLKPINPKDHLHPRHSAPSVLAMTSDESAPDGASASEPGKLLAEEVPDDSGESDDDEEEGEFEAFSGQQILEHSKKDKLHRMEVGEAAALLKQNRDGPGGGVIDEDEDD